MDDRSTHDEDEQQDNDLDLDDTEVDDEELTPEEESDDSEKETAEQSAERQEKAWLSKIMRGEKTLEDMPANLKWLKDKVQNTLSKNEKKPAVSEDDLEGKISQVLKKKEDSETFKFLMDDLEESDISAETLAKVHEGMEELKSDGVPQLKALMIARQLAGLKDTTEILKARRRKGMTLPPQGNIRRTTVNKDGMTPTERMFQNNLPKQFRPNK